MENNQLMPSVKKFPISNQVLEILENLDAFNSYRLTFRDLANSAANDLAEDYNANIKNLDDFLEKFPQIYRVHLEPLIKKAVDILITEGVWTVTFDSFLNQHLTDFHLAMDDYQIIINNFNSTLEANQQKTANMWSYVPSLMGGGFGIIGALKGIATATAYNLVRDGIESSVLKNANVKPEQRAQIYSGLNVSILFERVFTDYWRVFLSLVWTLNQNGKNIWWPTDEDVQQSANIFTNLSNPNFPQDKILEVLLQIIKTNPYNAEYYKFFIARFGDSEEFTAIRNYFGYTTFDDPRIV